MSKGKVPGKVLSTKKYDVQSNASRGFYQELVEDGVLAANHLNGEENQIRLRERFTRDFYNEVSSGDVDYKNPTELGGLKKYKGIVNDILTGVTAAPALRHIGMILAYRKQDLRESLAAYVGRRAVNLVTAPSARFDLMAEAVAMAALEQAAGSKPVDPEHVKALSGMIADAGGGPRDLFKDFRFASKDDIGKEETPIKMLHELPEIVAAAKALHDGKEPTSLELDESKYIFGRKEIAREGVKLIVGAAVDASFAKAAEVSSEYITRSAEELGAKLAHEKDLSRAKKIRDHLVDQMMDQVSIKAGGEKGKITVRELAERVAHPVGKGLLEAAITDKLLERTKTLEKVRKGWFDWAKGKTDEQKVNKEKFKSKSIAKDALGDFMRFDPENVETYSAANELKSKVNKEVSGRGERYEEAYKAVDFMVIQEMRRRTGSDAFTLDPLVVRTLAQHLYGNEEIDQLAFCSEFCDRLVERGGNLNKTIKLSHFEKKGDRTQGTWANYFRKASQKFWKSLGWTKSSTNNVALMDLLKEVGDSVKSGIPALRVYSSHRDARVAVEEAIKEVEGLAVNDAVLNALTKQVTVVLEKARMDGKKIYMTDIIDALQPGMEELNKRRRDSNGVITEKTIGDLLLTSAPKGGFKIDKKAPSKTLANICKEIVTKTNPGKDGLEIMGMTRKELVAHVLRDEKVHEAYLGNKAQEKSLVRAINSALEAYGEHPYTQEFITGLILKAVDSIKIKKTTDEKGVVEITPSFDNSLIESFVVEQKKVADAKSETIKKAIGAKLLEKAVASRAGGPAQVKASDGTEIISRQVPDEQVLPLLNSAKALFDFVRNNSENNPDECIRVINDPKYAQVLHDSTFFAEGSESERLGEYLDEQKVVTNPEVITAIKNRQRELDACIEVCREKYPDEDIKTLAENLDIVKSAGFGIDEEKGKFAVQNLIGGYTVPVYGIEEDKPVLLDFFKGEEASEDEEAVGRNKCVDLLRFIHSCNGDREKVAQFIEDRDISQEDKNSCEVNGKPLVDYIPETKGLDITTMPNAAEKAQIEKDAAAQRELAEASAKAEAEAAEAEAAAKAAAARNEGLRKVIAPLVDEARADAEARAKAIEKSGIVGAIGRAFRGATGYICGSSAGDSTVEPPKRTPANPDRGNSGQGRGNP